MSRRRRCARCDWKSADDIPVTPLDQARFHADDYPHPLCNVCTRSLRDEEDTHCDRCMQAVRDDLLEIEGLYALLPAELGLLRGRPLDGSRSSSDGRPVVGGDALVMLAAGGMGWSEDGTTLSDADTDSVPGRLAAWVDTWTAWWDEPVTKAYDARPAATVVGSVEWLRSNLWIMRTWPQLATMKMDLRSMRARLEQVTGEGVRALRSAIDCLDCGGDRTLHREYRSPRRCEHDGPHGEDCDQGGLEDRWTCWQCKRVYTDAEYWLAVAQHYEAKEGT